MLTARRAARPIALSILFLATASSAWSQTAAPSAHPNAAPGGDPQPYFAPPAAPVLDPHPTLTAAGSILLTGLAPGSDEVEIDAPTGRFRVPTAGDAFTADVPLAPNVMNAIYLTGLGLGGPSAPAATAVTQDGLPPNVFVDFPADGAEVTVDTIDVAGRVGDLLSGSDGVTVDVNGIRAAVDVGLGTNGTFLATDVPLIVSDPPTPTRIAATATDALGNSKTAQIVVTRIQPPPGAPLLTATAGDGQSGPIQATLAQPLVARVTQADGTTPIAGKLVTFDVLQSNGRLSVDGLGGGAMTLDAFTDANGEARAFWRLGSDAGCGNNRVEATSVGVVGTALYCASATPGPIASIQVGTGSGQTAETGAPLVQPLVAWVNDACNGLPGVPVTFTVTSGSGLVDGQSQVTVLTDLTGHAAVTFELGPEPGLQRVEATYAGNLGLPATFLARGVERGSAPSTSFSGLVVDNAGQGIGGAACTLEIGGQTLGGVATDASGQFTFANLKSVGPAHVSVDAATATSVGGLAIPMGSFPHLGFDHVVVPDVANTLSTPIRIPPLDPANDVFFDNTQDVELGVAGLPGLKMTVRAGSMTLPNGMVPDAQKPVVLALNQVHFDELPMTLPNGVTTPFAWTLQPGGSQFDPPVEIEMPNLSGLEAGAIAYFLSFDHDIEQFAIVAQGRVSADASVIRTEPGEGLSEAGWGGACPPYGPFTSAFGDVVSSWAPSMPFTLNVTALFALADKPCSELQDGTPEGELARKQCVQNGINCIQEFFLGALGFVDTQPTTPPATLPGVTQEAFRELQETLNATFGGTQVLTPAVSVTSQSAFDIASQMPGTIAEWTGDVTFPSVPDHLDFGDVVQLTGLEGFGFGPDSHLLFEVTAKNSPTSFSFAGRLYDPDQRPRCYVAVGNATFPLDEFGPFTSPQIAATGLVRPLIFCEGVGVQYVIGPSTFVVPNPNGPTDLGAVALTEFARLRNALTLSPGSAALTTPGETVQLVATATLDDGSQLDVTSPQEGSTHTSSSTAVATVSANGLVTAQGEGVAFVTTSNEGISATLPVTVSFGDPLTTVVGIVTAPGGAPVQNATVTVLPGSFATTTAADGSFLIRGVATELGTLTVFADASLGSTLNFHSTSVLDVAPVPGGFTDVGLIELEPAVFWAVDADGQWDVASNWSTGQVPGPNDRVVLDRPAGDFTITVDSTADVTSLRSQEQLNLASGGQLTVAEPLAVNNLFNLIGGSLVDTRIFPGTAGQGLTTSAAGGTLDGVTLSAQLAGFGQTTVRNGIELASGGAFSAQSGTANLIFDGTQTLSGTGELMLAATRVDVLNGTLTVEPGVTLRGDGTIGSTNQTVVMRGVVRAETGTTTLRGTLVNEGGEYRADPGQAIVLQGPVDNTGSVFTTDGEVRATNVTFTGGTYAGGASALLTLSGSNSTTTFEGVALFDSDAFVPLLTTLRIDGDLTIATGRTLSLDDAPLTFAGSATVSGDAHIVLSGNGRVSFQVPSGTLTVEPDVTIRGVGRLDGRTDNLIVLRGLVSAEGGSLQLDGVYQNDGGTYVADPGGEILLAPLTSSVCSIDNSGSVFTTDGPVRATNLSFTGGTWAGGPSSLLTLSGSNSTTTFANVALLDTDAFAPLLTTLRIDGGVAFGAGRTVTIQSTSLQVATGGGMLDGPGEVVLQNGRIVPQVTSDTITLGPSLTVRGRGFLGNPGPGAIVNQGAVVADVPSGSGEELLIRCAYTSSGVTTASAGCRLRALSSFVQTGGLLTIDGTLTADVDLQGGALVGTGTLAGDLSSPGGTVQPGGVAAAGTLTVAGTFDQGRGGALEVELGGTTPGSDHDVLAVTGATTLDGQLAVSLLGDFQPSVSEQFAPLTYGSATGTFGLLTGLDVGGGVVLEETYGPTAFALDAVPEP